jgi:hypothetical protein
MNYVPEDDEMHAELVLTDGAYDIRANGSYFPTKGIEQFT